MADVIANGVRFNVVQLGPPADVPRTRPPVVFVHGLIIDNLASFYYTLAPIVARETDVLCYDLRGHGRSERPLSGYRLEDAVADLCGILDATGFTEPVQLVGNSFGGTIVLRAALWAPERVTATAMLEPHPGFDSWAEDMVEDLEDLVEGFEEPGMRNYIVGDASRSMRRMIDCCEVLVEKSSLPDDFRLSCPTTPAELSAIRCPSLLLYGDGSDILDHGFALGDALPHSELRILEGCTHAMLMEKPDLVAEHIVPWLADPAHQVSPATTGRSA